jgi:hypothetical protein
VGAARYVKLISHFLDVALLPFNLPQWNSDQQNVIISSRRLFAQLIRDSAAGAGYLPSRDLITLFPGISSAGYHTIKWEIQKLGTSWREVETLLLGLNSDLLSSRIGASIPDALLLRPNLADISDEDIESWISLTLAAFRRDSLHLWLPIAEETIAASKIWEEKGRHFENEVEGQPFYFVGAVDGRTVQASFRVPFHWADDTRKEVPYPPASTQEEQNLLRDPVMIFAVAAGASARRLRWDEAFRFSDLCVEAARLSDDAIGKQNLKEAARLFSLIEKARATRACLPE